MAVKFKITPERVAEVCGYIEVMNLITGDQATVFRVAPRFVIDTDGSYIMQPEYDEDGDLSTFNFGGNAVEAAAQVTPKRLEKLLSEFSEAARNVVNPPNGKA